MVNRPTGVATDRLGRVLFNNSRRTRTDQRVTQLPADRAQITPNLLLPRVTQSPLFAKGRPLMKRQSDLPHVCVCARAARASHARAVKYFEEAVRIDPEYAPAWAGLSEGYT